MNVQKQTPKFYILLVEDDEDEQVIIRDCLSEITHSKFTFNWIADYDAGLEAISTGKYDLCLLDYFLGGRNGLDFIREAALRGSKTPIIFLTGWESRETDLQAMKEGASDYLVKGEISPSLLERSIRYAVERNKYQNQLEELVVARTAELSQSEERYRSVFENSLDGIMLTSPDGKIEAANPAACVMFGMTEEEIIRAGREGLIDPSDPRLDAILEERARSGNVHGELRHVRKDGTTFEGEGNSVVLEGGTKAFVIVRDVTERKRAEEALRAANADNERHLARLNALINQMTEGLIIFDPKGNLLDGNPAARAIHGIEDISIFRHQNIGQFTSILELFDLENNPLPIEKWPIGRVLRGESFDSYEVRVRRRDTGRTWIGSYGGTPVHDPEGKLIWCILTFRDVTERRRMEGELRELAKRLSYHVDNSPLAVIEWGPDMRLNRWAGAAERIFGWRADEVIGKKMEDFRWIYKEDEAQVAEVSSQLESGADPKRFSANRNYRKDGSVVHCEWYSSSLIDDSGKLRSILSLVLDVTERVQLESELKNSRDELELRVKERTAELEKANQALGEYASRLEILNRDLKDFMFVSAHDLHEPLRKIQVFSDLVLERCADSLDEAGQDYLNRLGFSAKRMQDLIRDIRSYSKLAMDPSFFKKIDLRGVVESALSKLKAKIEETGAKIEVGEFPSVEADPQLMRVLFQNLVGNALTYRGEEQPLIKISSARAGEDLQITVEDNGIGFDEKYADLIFKPFQRLHGRKEYKGTGMGLAICRKIVERHGGKIIAKSTPRKGSTFTIALPAERTRERLLREGAEKRSSPERATDISPEEAQRLEMELNVHRIELEMQNEKLRREQAELEALRERYYELFNKVPVGYVVLKPSGMITDVNQAGADMLGLKSRLLEVEIPLSRFVAPHHQERYYGHINALKKTGARQGCNIEMIDLKGKPFRGLLTSAPEKDEMGQVNSIRIAITDITHR